MSVTHCPLLPRCTFARRGPTPAPAPLAGRWLRAWLLLALALAAFGARAADWQVGGQVQVVAPVMGDLNAYGGRVQLLAPVNGDAQVSGGTVMVAAPVNGNLHAAGGEVSVQRPIGGTLRLAGGQVSIGPDATVGGSATVAGGKVEILGTLQGPSTVYGGSVRIDGAVNGPLTVRSERLELGSRARVTGTLTYSGRQAPIVQPGAQVGRIEQLAAGSGRGWLGWLKAAVIPALQAAALVVVLLAMPLWLAMFPGWSERAKTQLRQSTTASVLYGLLAAVIVATAIGILLITIIGSPIALLLMLLLPMVLLAGLFVGAGALGDSVIGLLRKYPSPRFMPRLGALLLGLVLLLLLLLLTGWGWPVVLLIWLGGVGALLRGLPSLPSTAAPTSSSSGSTAAR